MTDSPAPSIPEPHPSAAGHHAQFPGWPLLALMASLLIVDQATKIIAVATLKESAPIIFPGDLFRLQYAENRGAFLSLGAELSDTGRFLLLTVFNTVIVGVMSFLLIFRRPTHAAVTLALVCIIAGGIGNLIDRIFRDGIVVDFMNVGIGSLRSGIFNIADLAIVAGFLLFVCFGHKSHAPAP